MSQRVKLPRKASTHVSQPSRLAEWYGFGSSEENVHSNLEEFPKGCGSAARDHARLSDYIANCRSHPIDVRRGQSCHVDAS